VTSDLLQAHK